MSFVLFTMYSFKMAQNSRELELICSVLLSCSHKNDCSADNNKLLFNFFFFFEFLQLPYSNKIHCMSCVVRSEKPIILDCTCAFEYLTPNSLDVVSNLKVVKGSLIT